MERSKRRQQIKRGLERDEGKQTKIASAADQLKALYEEWIDAAPSTGRPKRLENQVQHAVSQLLYEIHAGKTGDVAERFQQAIERITAAHLSKKKATFLQTLNALQQLLEASKQWHLSASHSKKEQDRALHKLRVLLCEVEAGQVEHVEERFHEAMKPETEKGDVELSRVEKT